MREREPQLRLNINCSLFCILVLMNGCATSKPMSPYAKRSLAAEVTATALTGLGGSVQKGNPRETSTSKCYPGCREGFACNDDTGTCEPISCFRKCRADQMCNSNGIIESCVKLPPLEGAPGPVEVVPPPEATVPSHDPASPQPYLPVRIEVRDLRAGGREDGLRQATLAHARQHLTQRGMQIVDNAKTALQIDILAIDVTWKDGTGRSCSRLVGRTVREQEGYLALDVAAEKCVTEHHRSNGADPITPFVNLAAELIDPKKAPSAGTATYLSALNPLLVQLANQCRGSGR